MNRLSTADRARVKVAHYLKARTPDNGRSGILAPPWNPDWQMISEQNAKKRRKSLDDSIKIAFTRSKMKNEIAANLELIGALAIFLLEKTGSIYGTFTGRLTAEEQRRAFGCVPFGKLKVRINGQAETVSAYRKVCFGSDFECSEFTWLEFEKECRANRHPFRLGRYSSTFGFLRA